MIHEHDPQTYAIIGAALTLRTELGPGFLESVYHEALNIELGLREIPFRSRIELPVLYKGIRLSSTFRADLICFDDVVVELKALKTMSRTEGSQLLNYLKATGLKRGLLLNFGTKSLQPKRMVL
jgi:GxxExxY protein